MNFEEKKDPDNKGPDLGKLSIIDPLKKLCEQKILGDRVGY